MGHPLGGSGPTVGGRRPDPVCGYGAACVLGEAGRPSEKPQRMSRHLPPRPNGARLGCKHESPAHSVDMLALTTLTPNYGTLATAPPSQIVALSPTHL